MLSEIYLRILESASTAQMTGPVIKAGIGKVANLRMVLCDLDPASVTAKYSSAEQVFSEIKTSMQPRGKVREAHNAIFPTFCRTALKAAAFLSKFSTAQDFYRWAEVFNVDDDDGRIRLALPMVLHRNIPGLGFALSCDFLKEIGFEHFGKPDTWIIQEFEGVGLSEKDSTPEQVLLDLFRVARNAGIPAYRVDKVFWLISSGNFHLHGVRVEGKAAEFIRDARKELRSLN